MKQEIKRDRQRSEEGLRNSDNIEKHTRIKDERELTHDKDLRKEKRSRSRSRERSRNSSRHEKPRPYSPTQLRGSNQSDSGQKVPDENKMQMR